MFESLSERLTKTLRAVAGRGRLTEDNIRDSVRQVRVALLEADVALSVVRSFTADVQQRAVGSDVSASLDAGQAFVKIVQEELIRLMGEANDALDLSTTPPAVILVSGSAGRRQDRHGGQARALPEGAGAQTRRGCERRCLPPGRHRATRDAGRGRRRPFPAEPKRTRRPVAIAKTLACQRQEGIRRCAASSTPPAGLPSTRK